MRPPYLVPPLLQKEANSPSNHLIESALSAPFHSEPMWKTLAKGVGIAGGLAVGGKIVDKVVDTTSHYLGRALARKRMKGHLDAMPLHVRQEVIGTHPEETIDARFDELYEISPTMMSKPQSAVGMVSETLRQNQHAVSPMAMKEMVDLENSINRGHVPGIGEELGRSMGDSIIRHSTEKAFTDPLARIREHAAIQAIKDVSSRADADKEHTRRAELMRDQEFLKATYKRDADAAMLEGQLGTNLYLESLKAQHSKANRDYDAAASIVSETLADHSIPLPLRSGAAHHAVTLDMDAKKDMRGHLDTLGIHRAPSHSQPNYKSLYSTPEKRNP